MTCYICAVRKLLPVPSELPGKTYPVKQMIYPIGLGVEKNPGVFQ
jgi:hypothetical protein